MNKNKLKQALSRFRGNNRGIAYVWGVAACTICFFPLIYWALSVYLDGISTTVFAMYTFTGSAASSWLLCKTLIAALPFIILVIVLIWASVNSKAQAYEQ